MLAAHLDYDRAGDRDVLAAFWDAPRVPCRPGLKAVDLFRAVAAGRVRAIWIVGTNPAISMPEADQVATALAACPFLVVSDCMRETDTSDYAHVRLPALAWGEKDGSVTNSERMISRQRAFLPVPGAARPDWWMFAEVARRMGHGEKFNWTGPADIFREHAGLSGFRNGGSRIFDISGLACVDYATMAPVRWPVPAAGPPTERLFADGGFSTRSGRARLPPTVPTPPPEPVSAAYPLILLTGRVRDQWHTMTRTAKSPRLMTHRPEPFLSIHPDDARNLEEGGLARIRSAHGKAVLRVRLDAGQRRGCVFAPMHWTSRFCAAARVNRSVNAHPDPISGQPELKHTPVRVEAFVAGWHACLLSRHAVAMEAPYHARTPLGSAWRHEMAGDGTPAAAFAALKAAVRQMGKWIEMRDPALGRFRAVLADDAGVEALLFIDRTPAVPPREWLAARFGPTSEFKPLRSLLAGRPPDGRPATPTICVCHGVDTEAICAAIGAGADSLAAVGEATAAGTGCGSCRPEIRALLRTEVARLKEPV